MQFTKKAICVLPSSTLRWIFFPTQGKTNTIKRQTDPIKRKTEKKLNTRTTKNWSPFFIFSCPKNCQNVELCSCLNSILSKQPLARKGSLVFMLQRTFWKLGLECKQVAATTQHSWHQMATFGPNFGPRTSPQRFLTVYM